MLHSALSHCARLRAAFSCAIAVAVLTVLMLSSRMPAGRGRVAQAFARRFTFTRPGENNRPRLPLPGDDTLEAAGERGTLSHRGQSASPGWEYSALCSALWR